MTMLVFKSNSFVVKYENNQLHLSGSEKLETSEFKTGITEALEFAEKRAIKHWLFDLSEMDCLNEDKITYVLDYLFPQIMIKLGAENFVAVNLSYNCYQKLFSQVGITGMRSYSSFIVMNVFCDVKEAATWLRLEEQTEPI
jgi:hypothetical protein